MLAYETYKQNLSDIDQTLEPFDCSLHRTEPAPFIKDCSGVTAVGDPGHRPDTQTRAKYPTQSVPAERCSSVTLKLCGRRSGPLLQ